MHYRTDIEGLRALAVLLVIAYHYQFPGITGGFIGVDVFFVISGFVITQLLMRSMAQGTFSFADFYARRIRRLVPVFLLVSTASFLLISPYYLDDDYYVFSKSWLSSLVGVSNFYYFSELNQYFAPETQSLTLLHTWSLAVEEQFYLLWPLTLLLVWRCFRSWGGVRVFLFIVLLALLLSVYLAETAPKAAYYLLPARLFELLLGAGVALHASRLPVLQSWMAQIVATTGLVLIVATGLLLDNSDHFPGYNALWPTLGTALIIYAGLHQPGTWVARLLSLRWMVFLGGISYSLYLWHWPIVALLHYQLVELTWPIRLSMVAGVILLSWLSYRLVENPFRYTQWRLGKLLLLMVLAPAVLMWAVQVTIRLADDISFRIPEERRELYKIIEQNDDTDLYKACFKGPYYQFNTSAKCLFGVPAPQGEPNSILIGDSHAIALMGFVEELIAGTDRSLLLVTQASTPFVLAEHAATVFGNDSEKIDRSRALTEYLSKRPMTVFVSAYWDAYLASSTHHRSFLAAIGWLVEQGHDVIILEDVPTLPSAAHAHCLLKNMPDCSIDAAPVRQRLANFERFKAEIRAGYPQVAWINPREIICDDARCQTVLNGIPLYRDADHLNNLGAREIARAYLQRFGNPLLGRYSANP